MWPNNPTLEDLSGQCTPIFSEKDFSPDTTESMCRLFAFRSVIPSQVHRSLVDADNALLQQSNLHPDGWGVTYYIADSPHTVKSVQSAVNDSLFKKISGIVSSQTVVAHLRRATLGEINITNTHPFQFGRWIFAHNGNIKNFNQHKKAILNTIDKNLARFILGTTDSEVFFFYLLHHITKKHDLHATELSFVKLKESVVAAISDLEKIIGPLHIDNDGPADENYLSFILTNGTTILAHQGGKSLYFSTHKSKCSERENCSYLEKGCENSSSNGDKVNHLVFSSEVLIGENVWQPLANRQIVGVDWQMKLQM